MSELLNNATLWTAVAAVAAVFAVVVSTITTYLTLVALRSEGEPRVIAFVRYDPNTPTFLFIILRNVGHDIAQDVRFVSSRPIPAMAFGLNALSTPPTTITDGPLVNGIPSFGPGESRTILWGQYAGITAALGGEPITLTYSYRYRGRTLRGVSTLEVESYRSTDGAMPETPMKSASRSLKSIDWSLQRLAKAATLGAARSGGTDLEHSQDDTPAA